MIQENELRIGNLVEWSRQHDICASPEIVQVYNISLSSIRAYTDIEELPEILIHYDDISPIPLTPEWLERAGFEKKVDGFISTKWHIGINPVTQDYLFDVTWLSNFDRPFYRNGHFKIDYVHQLQNLYFALTGKELEFK